MNDLIAALELAEEGSRELDALIAVTTKSGLPKPMGEAPAYLKLPSIADGCAVGTYCLVQRSGMSLRTAAHYTTSLDAALTLVEKEFDWDICFRGEGNRKSYFANVGVYKSGEPRPTPALALCIASLKAKAAMKENG